MKATPTGSDRLGWYNHYVTKFNKEQRKDTEHLALWYLLLHLAFGTK